MQNTVSNNISCYGIGVHSGELTHLTLKPGKANSGIIFVRTDIRGIDNVIPASYLNIKDTTLSSNLRNNAGVRVSTIEHLMAALWGCGIDNVVVELDGPEVPIMDGSSKAFVFMILCAGKKLLSAPKKYLKILKDIDISIADARIEASPADLLSLDVTIDFKDKVIGKQNLSFNEVDSFMKDISEARTFGFVHELNYLKSKGLAKGASLDNAIGVESDIILNHEGLRYKDEFVRHKILDQIGDFYTCTGHILGSIKSYKSGHNINNEFLKKLFSNVNNYAWVDTI